MNIRIFQETLVLILVMLTPKNTLEFSYKQPKICTDVEEEAKCEAKMKGERVTCRGDVPAHPHREYWDVKVLSLCQWSQDFFNPEDTLRDFPELQKLVFRHSNISKFLTDFPRYPALDTIILSNSAMEEVRPSLFAALSSLRQLDLTDNLLRRLDSRIIVNHPSLSKVHLAGNPWDCSQNMTWMYLDETKIVDREELTCGEDHYFGKPVSGVMRLAQAMDEGCPKETCSCSMVNVVWDTTQRFLVPVITVDCSKRGLQVLPASLPLNTTTLLLQRNNISDLQPLAYNPSYANIADVYLDYNLVSSVDVLEGSTWLKNFRVLSLRENRLNELPTYALDNAFERNSHMVKVYLGGNPWRCDCLFTPDFQHLLVKYITVMKDVQDVRCADLLASDHTLMQVLELSKSSICQEHTHEINPLDILSGVLGCLIVLVLGKLAYDYYTFKRTGKLPWLVAKMP